MALYKRVSIMMLQNLRHGRGFAPKNRNAINRSSPFGKIRRLEILESKMIYTARGKCSVYYASRVGVFFLKKVYEC